jgi:hypothetical protein
MVTNPPRGDGHRQGAVREQSQAYDPKSKRWVKRDSETDKFMDQKADRNQFSYILVLLRSQKVDDNSQHASFGARIQPNPRAQPNSKNKTPLPL